MLGIAVFAAVAAVGTFLSWAIRNGYLRLAPEARVAIGLIAAVGLGAWGLRLRKRERSFGSSIVGLALVIVHVCAYAAGPGFHIVPVWVAFGFAALLSWVLAIFAHGENDEPLWCVGFGGAALAPFVTSDGAGNLYGLLIYGAVVLLPACFAISHRDWPIGWRVFYLISGLFTLVGASLSGREGTWGFIAAFAFPWLIAAAGVVPFAPEHRKRAALRWLALLGVLTSFASPHVSGQEAFAVTSVLLAAVALWLLLLDRQAWMPQSSLLERNRDNPRLLDWFDLALLPLILVSQGSEALRNTMSPAPVFVVATALFLVFAWRRAVNSMRDASAFAAMAVASGALAAVPVEEPLGRIMLFVLLALAAFGMHKVKPSLSWLMSGVLILLGTAAASTGELLDRPAYVFTPFLTEASATALVVLAGFVVVGRFWYWLRVSTRTAMGDRPEWTYAQNARVMVRGATVAPWVWAFLWAMMELSMAYSPSTATLLLVTYFAATAVSCVGAGRIRRSARLRQVGLGLALTAAATAFYGATTYFDFAARIAAYLVTSAFLLGIAYWYRRPGAGTADESQPSTA
jgi:hypothetical protein